MKFTFMCRGRPEFGPGAGRRVAIVGAGPAGLAAAGYLACLGYDIEVYDKLPIPGGMMMFAIPPYRVPRRSVLEGVKDLEENFGVKFRTSTKVFCGQDRHDEGDNLVKERVELKDIINSYDAVLLATGTWRSRNLRIPGEDAEGVYSALEYLFEIWAHMEGFIDHEPPRKGKVAVIGGGLSAVDAAEEAHRRGAEEVYMLYRRTIKQAPAGEAPIRRLIDMGIKWKELVQPVEVIVEGGKVKGLKLVKMRLGAPDASGRPRPEPIPGSEFTMDFDIVIAAIGEIATPPFEGSCEGIEADRKGRIVVDNSYRTGNPKVYAAGDVVTGPSKIGSATVTGLRAAKSLHLWLLSQRV